MCNSICFAFILFFAGFMNNAHNSKNGASEMTHTHTHVYKNYVIREEDEYQIAYSFVYTGVCQLRIWFPSQWQMIFFLIPVIMWWYELNDIVLFCSVHNKMHNDYYEWFAKKNRFFFHSFWNWIFLNWCDVYLIRRLLIFIYVPNLWCWVFKYALLFTDLFSKLNHKPFPCQYST